MCMYIVVCVARQSVCRPTRGCERVCVPGIDVHVLFSKCQGSKQEYGALLNPGSWSFNKSAFLGAQQLADGSTQGPW